MFPSGLEPAGLALLALSGIVLAAPNAEALDCADNYSDGVVYETATSSYDILCGIDYAGGDVAAAPATSFEECINLCDAVESCLDVSYGHGNCWMKDRLLEPLPNGAIWTARSKTRTPSSSLTCDGGAANGQTYTASAGGEFTIACGVDYFGGDMGMGTAATFEQCMDMCDTNPGCLDVSYVGQACYMKNALTTAVPAGHVWTGRKGGDTSTSDPDPDPTDPDPETPTTPDPPAGTPPLSYAPPACPGSDETSYLAATGSLWHIICGREHYGGDLTNVQATDFQKCIDACAITNGCVDVSYVGQTCYMKSALSTLVAAPHVWTAVLLQMSAEPPIVQPPALDCSSGEDSPSHGTLYTTPSRNVYEILCGHDFAGGDMGLFMTDSFETCLNACDQTAGCIDVAFTNGHCYLKNVLNDAVLAGHVWGAKFVSVAEAPEPPSSTANDSPPLITDGVEFPSDPSWTATYTYYEATLPTFTSTPVTIPTPMPTPTCLVDPTADGLEFYLIDQYKGFIVDREGQPGTPQQPLTEEEAEAIRATLDEWQPPTYKFEQPTGAPDGLYDLVLQDESGKRYISLLDTGVMAFVEASDGVTTTIFGVTCQGKLTVTKAGVAYLWMATEDDLTGARVQEDEGQGILLLPPSMRSPIQVPQTQMQKLFRRDSGGLPRCPGTPSNVWPVAKPFRRPENPNGCGSANGMGSVVPDWNFGRCCNEHDNCYDDCNKSFDLCNNDFRSCMRRQCWDDIPWYLIWTLPACNALADFYAWFVSNFGASAFYTANSERCVCPCRPADRDLCLVGQELQCIYTRGSDSNNCGGCGWKCGYKTHCSGAKCVCDQDQCGNVCLDLGSHPRNCGRCGNVCDSGYCYQGRCYDPPAEPEFCIPMEGFTNGDFRYGNSTGWTVTTPPIFANSIVQFGVVDNTANPDQLSTYINVQNTYPGGAIMSLDPAMEFSQNLRLCPGVAYDLEFRFRPVTDGVFSIDTGSDWGCFIRAEVGNRVITLPYSMSHVGFPGWSLIFPFAPQWYNMGPIRIASFSEGEAGTSPSTRHYLAVKFTMKLVCQSNSKQYIDDFTIHPA